MQHPAELALPRGLTLEHGDPLDLDERFLLKEPAHLEERHRGIMTAEMLAEHFAERLQLRHVVVAAPNEHVELDHVAEPAPGLANHRPNIGDREIELAHEIVRIGDSTGGVAAGLSGEADR